MAAFDTVVFDPEYDFNGVTLVEASAGTGKTYQIQNVYLRLTLAEGLPVEKILVVTFTEAATRELRERMRAILVKCNAYLSGRLDPADPDRDRLERVARMPVKEHGEPNDDTARKIRVRTALMNFDHAAIFTIHGFCHRILQSYAFECGHDPDAELLENDTGIIGDICRNWWRKHRYAGARDPAAPLFANVSEVQALATSALGKPDAKLLPAKSDNQADVASLAAEARQRVAAYLEARQPEGRLGRLKPKTKKKIEGQIAELHDSLQKTETAEDDIADQARDIVDLSREATWFDASKNVLGMRDFAPELPPALAALANAGLAEKAALIETLRMQILASIRQRQMLTYDGMLSGVRAALKDERLGPALLLVLREEFAAALIDEFQDTDPVQYDIFERIFSVGKMPLVFVGDPKQAIYGFRGGDIYAYFRAKSDLSANDAAGRIHRLPRNYRSDTALMAAVNTFFSDTAGRSFMNEHIQYETVEAKGLSKERSLEIDSAVVDRPLRVWRYDLEGSIGQDSPFARHVYARAAAEITRLLNDRTVTLGERRLQPSDFAVLVTTHVEADAIHAELLKRGVNAVKQKSGRIFECDEARAMPYLMQAMLTPNNPIALCTALSFDVMPCAEPELRAFHREDGDGQAGGNPSGRNLEDWMALMDKAGTLWHRHSFLEAFGVLEKETALRAHIVGLDDGERRLTNLLHLADLAHQAARSQQLGPEGLLRWMVAQLDERSRTADKEDDLRLSSDEDAVNIMTIFKSKGLEFPIVFVPTLWRKSTAETGGSRDRMLLYHDDEGQLVLNLDKGDAEGKAKQARERLEEHVRLAYVALTRAANMTYLVAINRGEETKYALNYLWNKLDQAQAEHIDIDDGLDGDSPPEVSCERYRPEQEPPAPQSLNDVPRAWVDKRHGKTSFSALVHHDAVFQDTTSAQNRDEEDAADARPTDDSAARQEPDWIFKIAGGAITGTCWHDVLETLDFRADEPSIETLVSDELDRTGICRDVDAGSEAAKRGAVQTMVRNVLGAGLRAHGDRFALRDIPLAARRSELQFDFALRQTGERSALSDLHAVMDRHWRTAVRDEAFLAALRNRQGKVPLGYMDGFIDLVFMRKDRFYIVDWKSNRIDGRIRNFELAGLQREMARHFYYLQYMIYAVGLDAFLRQKVDHYSFEKHFGGVFYFFLRGVNEAGRGILYDPLSKELVEGLGEKLGTL